MSDVFLAIVFAVLTWWFTTGVILFLDGQPRSTFKWSMVGATLILGGALFQMRVSAADPSVSGAYSAFTCAVLVWGWLEMSFLMGFITGSRKAGCAEGCRGWPHFVHATQAIAYNELATLAGAGLVLALTWAAPNKVALWTFLVLWTMRLSAKLNLFFGIPNTGEKLLPPHLQYLKSFFRKRSMNFLFPISISASTAATALLVQRCLDAAGDFQLIGYTLVTSLLALAVLEHWFMVLPWNTDRLWNWGLKSRTPPTAPKLQVKAPSEC